MNRVSALLHRRSASCAACLSQNQSRSAFISPIDPVMLEQSGSQSGDEGCLSVPGLIGSVERPSHIKIEALDLDGNKQVYEFDDFDARVMCHEYDHFRRCTVY